MRSLKIGNDCQPSSQLNKKGDLIMTERSTSPSALEAARRWIASNEGFRFRWELLGDVTAGRFTRAEADVRMCAEFAERWVAALSPPPPDSQALSCHVCGNLMQRGWRCKCGATSYPSGPNPTIRTMTWRVEEAVVALFGLKNIHLVEQDRCVLSDIIRQALETEAAAPVETPLESEGLKFLRKRLAWHQQQEVGGEAMGYGCEWHKAAIEELKLVIDETERRASGEPE